MNGPLPAAGPSAVRIAGDRYQWLHVWRACLQVLRDNHPHSHTDNPAVAVGLEAKDAANVDDCVLYHRQTPHTYAQIKWTANAATPIGTDYLASKATQGGTSLLAKLVAAHRQLTANGEPVDMVIKTNRNIDPDSVLLAGLDPRTQLLLPHAAKQGPRSERGKERASWAAGADATEQQLLDLLAVLRFETGHTLDLLIDNTRAVMTAAGLRSDDTAILTATSWVEQQVVNGIRRLGLDTIRAATLDLDLHAGRAWSTVSIATLKPDPLADQAVHALDWVDRFDGDDPYTRRRPRPPATWAELAADIDTIPAHLDGADAVLITGSLRLPTGFAIGASLRKVTGVDVAWRQGPDLWRSDEPYLQPFAPDVTRATLDQGDDVAIVVDIATRATPDVIEWLTDSGAPVGPVLTLTPPAGPTDQAIPDGATAIALAVGIRDIARRAARTTSTIHLFQAGPLGLAVLLGHRWNRVTTTHLYEDIKTGYEHAFTIDA